MIIRYDSTQTFKPNGPMLYETVCKGSSQSLHPLQNHYEMKTPTFVIMEHSDDVSDVDAKNTDFEPQNVVFRATDFYSFTTQSMLKFFSTIGAWFK